ncbi:MAG TPA: threonine synthase [Candidatus Limnocylindria bacterium]|jgi:threonine synthase|nr:threonine synthase [Candidatus Limnocylindria bacterium]
MATTLERTTALRGFRCRACQLLQPADERYVCSDCYGPIEPEYDLAALDPDLLREEITRGPRSLWRYAPLLPVAEPASHYTVGWTPLHLAPRLGAAIGVERLYLKDDSRNPSLSFKDRPVALALARALAVGLDTLACASTGNLAGAVAAAAARNGLRAFVFVPEATDESKVAGAAAYGATVVRVRGTYDQVNRLCARLADEEHWGFVNFTLRPYYAEGSKTLLFETAEQLDWTLPDHVVVPVGSGALLTRTATAVTQLRSARLVDDTPCRIHAAQPVGCAPVSDAVLEGFREVRPVRAPTTVARSLAIGTPADGDGSVAAIRASGGSAAAVTDEDVLDSCALLARTEGVLAEPAGGVVVAAARALAKRNAFQGGESVVLYITGNAYKGQPVSGPLGPVIGADADEFRGAYVDELR